MEGVASHHGPVSCAGGGNIAGEASIGVRTGQPLSSEITTLGTPTGLPEREGHAARRVRRERRSGPTESKTLACAGTLCSRTGRSQRLPKGIRPWGRSGKARDRNPDMHAAGKSDIGVVPENVPNKAGSGEVGGHGGTGRAHCRQWAPAATERAGTVTLRLPSTASPASPGGGGTGVGAGPRACPSSGAGRARGPAPTPAARGPDTVPGSCVDWAGQGTCAPRPSPR